MTTHMTKTWFVDGEFIEQEIPESEIYKQEPEQAQPTEERNFCPRCGKRLASGVVEISIHTCTPPKENT